MEEKMETLAAFYQGKDEDMVEFTDDLLTAAGAVCQLNVEMCRKMSDGTKLDMLLYMKCIYDEAVEIIMKEKDHD